VANRDTSYPRFPFFLPIFGESRKFPPRGIRRAPSLSPFPFATPPSVSASAFGGPPFRTPGQKSLCLFCVTATAVRPPMRNTFLAHLAPVRNPSVFFSGSMTYFAFFRNVISPGVCSAPLPPLEARPMILGAPAFLFVLLFRFFFCDATASAYTAIRFFLSDKPHLPRGRALFFPSNEARLLPGARYVSVGPPHPKDFFRSYSLLFPSACLRKCAFAFFLRLSRISQA